MAKAKAKAKTEDEEIEVDLELEETEVDSEETDKSSKKKGKKDDVKFGVRDLCNLIKEKTEKEYSPRDLRTLLRKMAREDNPRIDREVIAGNKQRYEWDGPNDPEVKAILKAVSGGEIEAGRKEALDKLKKQKAEKDAGKKKGKDKKSKSEDD